eukprot:scaffold5084_cov385-Prasinococcus_capsulatus_cf.AAC.7
MVAFNGNIAFFWITVILSFLAGGATSVFQSGMFGLGGTRSAVRVSGLSVAGHLNYYGAVCARHASV